METRDTTQQIRLPYGTIISYSGATVPENWLLCNGQAVSRTTYSELFAVLGTKFGSGNGSSTFNLPNLNKRFIQGTQSNSVGTLDAAAIPNIKGTFSSTRYDSRYNGHITGSFIYIQGSSGYSGSRTGSDRTYKYYYDAGRVSPVYRDCDTVQPPSVRYYFIIKAK